MVDIIASGHLCLDLLPGMDHVPLAGIASPGKLFEVDALQLSTGGSVANTGVALHILGNDVGLMGNVGGDLIGRVIIATLKDRDENLAAMIKVKDDLPSSYTIVLSPENQDRIFLHCAGTNAEFGVADIDFERVKDAKIFHLGYPPILPAIIQDDGKQLLEIYQQAKATGIITSLDTSWPDPGGVAGKVNWHSVLGKTLPYVDIFLPSIDELVMMLRKQDYDAWNGDVFGNITRPYLDELANEIFDMGVAICGFKLSHLGFYARTTPDAARMEIFNTLPIDLAAWTGKVTYHPAFVVDVVGTTGAGDAAYAGFLTGMFRGLSLERTVQMACAVGACNVEQPDATSGLRSWDETVARVDAGWAVRDIQLTD